LKSYSGTLPQAPQTSATSFKGLIESELAITWVPYVG
jgi:hypothetical protein